MAFNFTKLPKTQFSGLNFENIIDDIQNLIKENPEYNNSWDDFLSSNAGGMLVELFAYIADQLSTRVDWFVNEGYIGTATQPKSVARLLKLIGYNFTQAKCSNVKLDLDGFSVDGDESISSGFTIGTTDDELVVNNNIGYLTANDLSGDETRFEFINYSESNGYNYFGSVPITVSGNKSSTILYQGETKYKVIDVTTTNGQSIELTDESFIEGSIKCYKCSLNDYSVYERKEMKKVNTFLSSEVQLPSINGDEIIPYVLNYSGDNTAVIELASQEIIKNDDLDSIRIPDVDNKILIIYRSGGGVDGNIVSQAINTTLTIDSETITAINTSAGFGGDERESMESAASNAPKELRTCEVLRTEEDYDIILNTDSTIIKAKSYGNNNMPAGLYEEYNIFIKPLEVWNYVLKNMPTADVKTQEYDEHVWFDFREVNRFNKPYSFGDSKINDPSVTLTNLAIDDNSITIEGYELTEEELNNENLKIKVTKTECETDYFDDANDNIFIEEYTTGSGIITGGESGNKELKEEIESYVQTINEFSADEQVMSNGEENIKIALDNREEITIPLLTIGGTKQFKIHNEDYDMNDKIKEYLYSKYSEDVYSSDTLIDNKGYQKIVFERIDAISNSLKDRNLYFKVNDVEYSFKFELDDDLSTLDILAKRMKEAMSFTIKGTEILDQDAEATETEIKKVTDSEKLKRIKEGYQLKIYDNGEKVESVVKNISELNKRIVADGKFEISKSGDYDVQVYPFDVVYEAGELTIYNNSTNPSGNVWIENGTNTEENNNLFSNSILSNNFGKNIIPETPIQTGISPSGLRGNETLGFNSIIKELNGFVEFSKETSNEFNVQIGNYAFKLMVDGEHINDNEGEIEISLSSSESLQGIVDKINIQLDTTKAKAFVYNDKIRIASKLKGLYSNVRVYETSNVDSCKQLLTIINDVDPVRYFDGCLDGNSNLDVDSTYSFKINDYNFKINTPTNNEINNTTLKKYYYTDRRYEFTDESEAKFLDMFDENFMFDEAQKYGDPNGDGIEYTVKTYAFPTDPVIKADVLTNNNINTVYDVRVERWLFSSGKYNIRIYTDDGSYFDIQDNYKYCRFFDTDKTGVFNYGDPIFLYSTTNILLNAYYCKDGVYEEKSCGSCVYAGTGTEGTGYDLSDDYSNYLMSNETFPCSMPYVSIEEFDTNFKATLLEDGTALEDRTINYISVMNLIDIVNNRINKNSYELTYIESTTESEYNVNEVQELKLYHKNIGWVELNNGIVEDGVEDLLTSVQAERLIENTTNGENFYIVSDENLSTNRILFGGGNYERIVDEVTTESNKYVYRFKSPCKGENVSRVKIGSMDVLEKGANNSIFGYSNYPVESFGVKKLTIEDNATEGLVNLKYINGINRFDFGSQGFYFHKVISDITEIQIGDHIGATENEIRRIYNLAYDENSALIDFSASKPIIKFTKNPVTTKSIYSIENSWEGIEESSNATIKSDTYGSISNKLIDNTDIYIVKIIIDSDELLLEREFTSIGNIKEFSDALLSDIKSGNIGKADQSFNYFYVDNGDTLVVKSRYKDEKSSIKLVKPFRLFSNTAIYSTNDKIEFSGTFYKALQDLDGTETSLVDPTDGIDWEELSVSYKDGNKLLFGELLNEESSSGIIYENNDEYVIGLSGDYYLKQGFGDSAIVSDIKYYVYRIMVDGSLTYVNYIDVDKTDDITTDVFENKIVFCENKVFSETETISFEESKYKVVSVDEIAGDKLRINLDKVVEWVVLDDDGVKIVDESVNSDETYAIADGDNIKVLDDRIWLCKIEKEGNKLPDSKFYMHFIEDKKFVEGKYEEYPIGSLDEDIYRENMSSKKILGIDNVFKETKVSVFYVAGTIKFDKLYNYISIKKQVDELLDDLYRDVRKAEYGKSISMAKIVEQIKINVDGVESVELSFLGKDINDESTNDLFEIEASFNEIILLADDEEIGGSNVKGANFEYKIRG